MSVHSVVYLQTEEYTIKSVNTSVAERSFPLLSLVEMLCQPPSQSLLNRWGQLQDHLDEAQGLKDFKIAPLNLSTTKQVVTVTQLDGTTLAH